MSKTIPNVEQKKFIDSNSNKIVVNAGPGSGKTTALVEYLAKQIKNMPNTKILVSSFSNIATNNIKNKFKKNYSNFSHNFIFSTLDKFFIKEFYFKYKNRLRKKTFDYFKKKDSYKNKIKSINKDIEIQNIEYRSLKTNEDTFDKFSKILESNDYEAILWEFWEKINNGILLLSPIIEMLIFKVILKNEQEKIIKHFNNHIEIFVLDEAQDANYSKLYWLKKIGEKSGKIILVGDINQNLYSFTGCDKKFYKKEFLNNRDYEKNKISINYRFLNKKFNKFISDQNETITNNILSKWLKNEKKENNDYGIYILNSFIELNDQLNLLNKDKSILLIAPTNKHLDGIYKKIYNKNDKKIAKINTLKTCHFKSHIDYEIFENIYVLYLYNVYKPTFAEKKIKDSPINNIVDMFATTDSKFEKLYFSILKLIKEFNSIENANFETFLSKVENILSYVVNINEKYLENFKKMLQSLDEEKHYLNYYVNQNLITTCHSAKGLEADYVFLYFKDNFGNLIVDEKLFVSISRHNKKLFLLNFDV